MADLVYRGEPARVGSGSVYTVYLDDERIGTVRKDRSGWTGLAQGHGRPLGPFYRRKDAGKAVLRRFLLASREVQAGSKEFQTLGDDEKGNDVQ